MEESNVEEKRRDKEKNKKKKEKYQTPHLTLVSYSLLPFAPSSSFFPSHSFNRSSNILLRNCFIHTIVVVK